MSTEAKHVAATLAFIGDGQWWARADCLSHPQAHSFVRDRDAAIAELRHLFPSDVCVDLVQNGHGAQVIGLFVGDGWCDDVDELLQLGSDLTLCSGWRDDDKLVADLRHVDAYHAARFEVGVWAGLQRIGLPPEREPAANRATRRADYRVVDGGHRVAIELKSLSDPQRARNLGLLDFSISSQIQLLGEDIGTISLEPGSELDDILDGRVEAFRQALNTTIWPTLSARLRHGIALGRHEIEGVGTLVVGPRDPTWSANQAGSIGVLREDDWTLEYAARRVLQRVVSARKQLIATDADLRAAVVWGGLDHVPCRAVGSEVARQIAAGFEIGAVDYIAILNSHRRGPRPGWTTEAYLFATRDEVPAPDSVTWPRALVSWSLLHQRRQDAVRGTP